MLVAKKTMSMPKESPVEEVIKFLANQLLNSTADIADAHNSFNAENTTTGEETTLYLRITISRESLDPAVNPDIGMEVIDDDEDDVLDSLFPSNNKPN